MTDFIDNLVQRSMNRAGALAALPAPGLPPAAAVPRPAIAQLPAGTFTDTADTPLAPPALAGNGVPQVVPQPPALHPTVRPPVALGRLEALQTPSPGPDFTARPQPAGQPVESTVRSSLHLEHLPAPISPQPVTPAMIPPPVFAPRPSGPVPEGSAPIAEAPAATETTSAVSPPGRPTIAPRPAPVVAVTPPATPTTPSPPAIQPPTAPGTLQAPRGRLPATMGGQAQDAQENRHSEASAIRLRTPRQTTGNDEASPPALPEPRVVPALAPAPQQSGPSPTTSRQEAQPSAAIRPRVQPSSPALAVIAPVKQQSGSPAATSPQQVQLPAVILPRAELASSSRELARPAATQRSVDVHIGSIEVRLSGPQQAVRPAEAPPAPVTPPAGFGDYTARRSYRSVEEWL